MSGHTGKVLGPTNGKTMKVRHKGRHTRWGMGYLAWEIWGTGRKRAGTGVGWVWQAGNTAKGPKARQPVPKARGSNGEGEETMGAGMVTR